MRFALLLLLAAPAFGQACPSWTTTKVTAGAFECVEKPTIAVCTSDVFGIYCFNISTQLPNFRQNTTETPPQHHQGTTAQQMTDYTVCDSQGKNCYESKTHWAAFKQGEGPALPDPKLTPGAIRTSDATEICAKSFRTKKYRKTTQLMKKQVCANYHFQGKCPDAKHLELDHLCPLELGCADTMTNLWPQPEPAFHAKDKLENRLKALVCKEHAMTLPAAQNCIISDWAICYRKIFGVAP